MFRMNGMPRAQEAQERLVSISEQLIFDIYVAPETLRAAHPCAPSRSTVHPEHNGPEVRYRTPSAMCEITGQWFLMDVLGSG